jgi:hypothetical protein
MRRMIISCTLLAGLALAASYNLVLAYSSANCPSDPKCASTMFPCRGVFPAPCGPCYSVNVGTGLICQPLNTTGGTNAGCQTSTYVYRCSDHFKCAADFSILCGCFGPCYSTSDSCGPSTNTTQVTCW